MMQRLLAALLLVDRPRAGMRRNEPSTGMGAPDPYGMSHNITARVALFQGSKYESNTRTFFQLSLFSSMNFMCRSAFEYWS